MYVSFNSLPPLSRIWIYQSNKKFTSADIHTISQALQSFTENWKVHGQPMEASFEIRYDQFIILAANDQASGCSIDSSVRIMKDIGASIDTDFFDRTKVAFKTENEIVLLNLADLKAKYSEGIWNHLTPTFNNLVDTKSGLAENWLVASGSTWLKRYLPQETIAG
ncbi:MAG TPA: hypothetical protein VIN08_00565 [Ohtaekwangia sp.]|uniref:hypothetical protein n=1 Tax=Ohtaekwangia sp. TaxID=2066019 RepID=UPI002F94C42B